MTTSMNELAVAALALRRCARRNDRRHRSFAFMLGARKSKIAGFPHAWRTASR